MARRKASTLLRLFPGWLALAGLFVGLLAVATGLRFYGMPGVSVSYDEAVASDNASGTLSEVIPNTRRRNSSPILYPLALWAVQKVDISTFSIRVLPAMASVLTVAALLFLLPHAGVSRRVAFLAALLATLSVAAIEHARDAREYSLDVLLAVLLIAGLLGYLRDGRKALLCVSLFLAPLLQYGLVLFGAAVIGAALVLLPTPPLGLPERDSYLHRVGSWLKQRIALLVCQTSLVWPVGCFLTGCALSYAATLRYQWQGGEFASDSYLPAYHYQGSSTPALFEFSINAVGSLLAYHLPKVVAIAALAAGAFVLVAALLRKFPGSSSDRAIAVLFSLCLAISVGAAVLGMYPLGGIRQVIYLGPIVFLAAGLAFHGAAESLSALTRQEWLAPALAIAVTGAMALAGVDDLQQDNPYQTRHNTQSILAFLEERVREDDLVYADWKAAPTFQFHQQERPANYYYGNVRCRACGESCFRELADLLVLLPNAPNRIFLIQEQASIESIESIEGLALLGEQVSVERFFADGRFNIFLITYPKEAR